MNDSLLAQSYVEAYDISYPEALRRIEQEVDQIRHQIMYEGACSLKGIGVLTSNDEGNYCFEPDEAGVLTPSLYGLGSFEFPLLRSSAATPPKTVVEVIPQEEEVPSGDIEQPLIELIEHDDEDDHAIHIKMSWVRNAVAIAAAIILFLMMTTPIANSNLETETMNALQSKFFNKLIPIDSNMPTAIPHMAADTSVIAKETPKEIEKTDTTTKVMPDVDKPYCIVLASQVRRDNAEVFAKKMRNRGFKDTEVNVYHNTVRVVYGHFKSESAAYVELHNLRFEEDFEEAWVYKRKTEG